ncbi:hypothetical protein H4R34_002417 [Dimargaris verticillata]|uniref:Sjogrens syndrome scleroderma autoantigen 1 family protein n=1 Tax=Dimargaris verticillata TaxID=2761393 RepID=A0A9W8B6K8_9FUNG|nr:hypothetical protein H4R34_002417 [Dimargaris verticillata]
MSSLDSVTTALSQYMLKGWVLTDTECPNGCGVPLVRTKDNSQSVCVRCAAAPTQTNRETDHYRPTGHSARSREAELKPEPERSTMAQPRRGSLGDGAGSTSSLSPKPEALDAAAARRAKSDEIAQLISDRLLAGWTLLGEYCPNPTCETTPLIRLRKGPRYCVSCESTILTEAEYNAQRAASHAKGDTPQPQRPPSPPLARSSGASHQLLLPSRPKTPAASPTVKPRELAATALPTSPLIHTSTTDQPKLSDAQAAVHVAIAAISRRLAYLAQTLDHTTDTGAIAASAAAMTECARALEQLTLALRRLRDC